MRMAEKVGAATDDEARRDGIAAMAILVLTIVFIVIVVVALI